MGKQAPNPAGKHGKPITVPTMPLEEAVKKMFATQPPKHEPKAEKKPAKLKR